MRRKRSDDRPSILVCVWVFARQASSNRRQFCLRLSRCAPVSEPAEHLKEARVPRLIGESGQARERLPQVADDREPEAIRHDTDHDRGCVPQFHDRSDDVVPAAERGNHGQPHRR